MSREAVLFWSLLALASIGTFSLRLSFIALLQKIDNPLWFQRSLEYIPAAVMGALVSSSLLLPGGELAIGWGNHRLLAAGLAAVVGYHTRSLLWTILSGLVALFVLTHWLGPAI